MKINHSFPKSARPFGRRNNHTKQSQSKASRRRWLQIECLEDRRLLAALPVLDNSADPTLGQTQEDAGTPTGVVGTLVSALIDTDGPLDNFSDADGDLPGIAITGVNLQEGTLWSSENNGTGWQQVGTVSDASPRLLAADAGSRLYFQPAADFSGAINDVITFKAWDRTFILQQLGTDIDGEAAGDESGRTVSMSADGQTVAIGASGNDDNGIDSGHVRVYQWTGSAWQQQGSDIDGEAAGDEAGKWNSLSLSSDGQMVAIGALYNDGNGNDSGHVRIYQWSGSAWQQLGADIDGEAAGDASGFAVSLSSDGQTVATGALYNGGNGALAGHVRIHQWTGSEWQQLGADIDGEAAGDNVHSVSLSSDGQTVAIGARRNDGNGTDSGSTRVYQWTGSAWQQLGSDIDGEAAEDQSGYSLSLSSDGQIVAIGALYNDGNGTDSGSTRVYQWTGSAWQQVGSDIDGEAAEDLSGVSLSLSSNGQTVAIAAHSNDANGNRAGQVRLYGWSGSEWKQLGADIDGEAADDLSGGSVSLSSDGQTVAVGAMFNDGNGVDSGHVRIYRAHPVQSVAADSVSVTVDPINDDPTLDAISDLAIDEDAALETINLAGISAGPSETQTLRVTATSNNTDLIPNPTVTYTSADTTGSLAFTPVADQSGTATVTITVEDAGLDGDLATTSDNATFSRTFDVVVNPINDDPTLDPFDNITIDEDAAQQTVMLTGITAGGSESQPLRINATISNTSLIPDPTVTYASSDTTGSLSFTPLADAFGVTTITVTVEDGGLDGDLATATDNLSFSRTFDVTVVPINDPPSFFELTDVALAEDSGEFTIDIQDIAADSSCSGNRIINGDFLQGNSGFNSEYTFVGESNFPNSSFGYSIGTSGDHSGDGRMFVGNSVNHASTTTGNQLLFPVAWSQTVPVKQNATYEFSAWAREVTNTSNPSILEFSVNGTPVGVLDPTGVAASSWRQSVVDWQSADSTTALLEIVEIGGRTQTPGGGNDFALDDISFIGNCQGRESQPLRLAAASDNIALIPEPAVVYTSPATIGSLILEPATDAFGTATITVTVEDGGLDLDLATTSDNATFNRSFQVTVNPVNDAPVLDSLPDVVIDEDGVVHGAGTNLKLFVSDSESDESKIEFRIVNLAEIDPLFGLSVGMDPQSNSFALRGDSTIHVHPAANFFGSTQVTIEARDPEGDVSNQQTFNLVINSVNDRPFLDPSADLALANVVEDSGVPVGQVGFLVSTLIDENGPLANFSDIDGLAPGVAVVGKNIAVEKLWFSTDDGQNWQATGSLSGSEALLLIADTTTRVYAETAEDVSGELSDALSIKAWDQTGGHGNGLTGVDSTTNAFSNVTDTVSLSVEASPSSAADDFYSPLFDGTETFVISKSDFLANDTLGNGESIDTVTIITDTISSSGGTISVDGDVFTYTRPANWFSGIDTFGYTLADGGSTSTATVNILSGLNGDTLTITFEPGRDHEVTLQYINDKLVMVDHVTQVTLLNIPRDLVPLNVDVIGAAANSNLVTFSELSDATATEFVTTWSYEGGSEIDELTLLGSAGVWARLSRDVYIDNDVNLQLKQKDSLIDIYYMLAVESVRIAQVDRVAIADPYFEVQSDSFGFSTYQPVILPDHTNIFGGALNSTAPIALDAGKSLIGAGIVDGPFGGVTGSLIRANGNLEIGTDQSSAGFRTDGFLETNAHTVTINDSNRATLGELTTLGSESQTGTLLAKHGLTVPFTGNIEGYGTVDATNGETTSILLNNGSIAGNSSEQPITLMATVKGVGTMTNVVLDGTFTPGFSPTLSVNGDLVYSDRNTVEIELGGYLPGSGHDKIEHTSAVLNGKLVARLIEGYLPRPGAIFEILKSLNDFTGAFNSIELPSFDNGLRLEEIVDSRSISLETVFDTLDELHVLVSEQASFEISDSNDHAMKVRGSKFKAQVTPQHGFRSETSWFTDNAFMKDNVLIQSTTDGVNRIDIAGSRWKNFVSPYDINNDGKTSVLDALTLINELSRGAFVDLNTNQLKSPSELSEWPGIYYDTNGDDRGTALDALLVINELARKSNSSGEGELIDVAIEQWSRELTPMSTVDQTSEQFTKNPNFPSRIFSSSPEADNYVSSPQVVDAEYQSMGSESLKNLDESLLSLLAE